MGWSSWGTVPLWAAAPKSKEAAMPSITITIELTDQFIYDILTNWVEGGYSDWAAFSEVNRDVDTKDVISAVVQDAE
jgi:hypothetical protein